MFRIFACSAFAALSIATPEAQGPTIRVWKVGSPHTGDVPHTRIPLALAREADGRGWRLSIEAFPAQAFASRFLSATRNGTAPDVLVFDNMGIMNGIVTKLGAFAGIGQDPAILADRGVLQHVSVGQLWSTRDEWTWRVWSITQSGAVAFSEARTFVH